MSHRITPEMVRRVASAYSEQRRGQRRVANSNVGVVRHVRDQAAGEFNWGWASPGAFVRHMTPGYQFDLNQLKSLVKVLRATLMAFGHLQTARTTFTRIKSSTISPDGNLGGYGYLLPIKDIRKLFSNCDEALSSIADALYDEIKGPHWQEPLEEPESEMPEEDSVEVTEMMKTVEEIRESPESWAEEAQEDGE